MNKKNIKDFIILFGVIVIAAIGARVLASGETLADYAHKTGQDIESASEASDQGKELSSEDNTDSAKD